MKHYRFLLLILLGSFLVAGIAQAHRVNVFAWAEGDMVYVESRFSGGKRISAGKIIVTDSRGVELLAGQTNSQGEFSFKRPQPTELNIILDAGMGHRAQWTLPVHDGHADHPADQSSLEQTSDRDKPNIPDTQSYKSNSQIRAPGHAGPSPAEIEAIVEKALDKKMKPLLEMLAQSTAEGPGLTDILGGIGYIIGLVGIAAYFHSRRKNY